MALSGCYTALITPFNEDGRTVDFARLEEQIHFQKEGGVTGVVPCGTTGESPTLSDREHRAVFEKTVEIARPLGLQVIAGTGSNNTIYAVDLHRFAAEIGADASLQVNPYYNKPSQEGLYRHFTAVADAADLPVVLYNIPGRTGVALHISTIERLAKHPNIAGVKEATGSLDSASAICTRTDLTLLSGDDSMTLPFASLGGRGAISVLSNILPDRVTAMCNAFLSNDWPRASALHAELFPLAQALLTLDTNPVPIKMAMRILDRDTGALRLPMCPPAQTVIDSIADILVAAKVARAGKPVMA